MWIKVSSLLSWKTIRPWIVAILPWIMAIVPSFLLFCVFSFAWSYWAKNYLGAEAPLYESYAVNAIVTASLLSYFIIAGKQSRELHKLVKFIRDWLNKSPWWKATIVFPFWGAALYGFGKYIQFIGPSLREYEQQIVISIMVLGLGAYLCAGTFFASAMLYDEREAHKQELKNIERQYESKKVFDSDDGVLRNGEEVSIAMRVQTITHFLERLRLELMQSHNMTHEHVAGILYTSGYGAGSHFGERLPEIYDNYIGRSGETKAWNKLNFEGKLKGWFKYESENGLGKITLEHPPPAIMLRIQHANGLFAGPGGWAFSDFLSGACAAVIETVLKAHNKQSTEKTWQDYNAVSLGRTHRLVPVKVAEPEYQVHTVELSYKLRCRKEEKGEPGEKKEEEQTA